MAYWHQPLNAFLELLFLSGLAFGCLGLGRWLLKILGFSDLKPATEAAFSFGLGATVISYAVFALAAMQCFTKPWLIAVSCLTIATGGINFFLKPLNFIQDAKKDFKSAWPRIILSLIALNAAFNLLPALTPMWDWDGAAYHLALPKIYLAHGGFIFRPDIFHNLFPQFAEMLYSLGWFFPFGEGAKIIHWGFGLLAVLAIYALAKESGRVLAGLWGGVIFYSQYVVHIESGTAFIDLALAAYAGLALLAFWKAYKSPSVPLFQRGKNSTNWLFLGMFFVGVLGAIKWHGLIFAGLVYLAVSWRIWKQMDLTLKNKILCLVWLGLIGLLPAAPYLLRAWLQSGNPVWPLAFSIFGGKFWDSALAAAVTQYVAQYAGITNHWLGLLRLPYDLIVHATAFSIGGYELRWPVAGGILLTMAWWIWVRPVRKAMPDRMNLAVALVSLGFIIIWFKSSPQARFLLPLFPWLSWLAGRALQDLWQITNKWAKALAMVCGVSFFAFHPPFHHDTLLQARVLLGRVAEETYCIKKVEYYTACQYLNQHAQGGRVLMFGENRGFYLDVDYLWGDPLLQKVVDFRELKTSSALLNRLRQLGVDWVLYRTDLNYDGRFTPEIMNVMNLALDRAGKEEFAERGVRVFRWKNL